MIQIHWTMLIVITVLKHVYDQRKNGWTDIDAANFSYKLKLISNKSISVSRSVRHELFIVSVSKNRFGVVFIFNTAEFMIIAIKVILSVCFYLNFWQNRIESPNLFSPFKLVFLLLATFWHPSVNPGVQSNLGFPGKGGVSGYHGTILFLTCPGFLFQAGSLYNRRFCRVLRRVLMGERSKTRLFASCVRRCSGILSPLSIYWGKQK